MKLINKPKVDLAGWWKITIVCALLVSGSFQKAISQDIDIEADILKNGDWISHMQDPDVDFYALQSAFNKYWENRSDYKGNGYKIFRRWEYINEFRVLPNRKLQSPGYVLQTHNEAVVNSSRLKSASGSWSLVGPSAYPSNATSQPTGMGRVNAIAFHPTDANIIFVGAPSGGFWKTTDGGITWVNLSSDLPKLGVSSILVHPTNPSIIYIGTGDRDASDAPGIGVYKTTNGGTSWTQINNTMGNVIVGAMIMHPSNPLIILAATNGGIYKTIDGGTNWSQKLTSVFKDIKFKPGDPTVVYATFAASNPGARFYRSSNTGENWSHITSGIPNGGTIAAGARMVIGVSVDDPTYVYLVQIKQSDKTLQALLRSTDSGLSFSTQSTSPNILGYNCDGSGTASQATYDLCITVDPNDAETIYVGGINNWKSSNGGTTWTPVSNWVGSDFYPTNSSYNCAASVHADQHVLEWSPLTGKLYAGHDGGIHWSNDGGSTWTEISAGLEINQIYKIGQSATNTDLTIFGQQDNGTAVSEGSTITTVIGGDGTESIIDYSDPDYRYGCYVYGDIRRSTGGSYSVIASTGTNGIGAGESGAWVTPYIQHVTVPGTMFAGYENVFRSTNVKTSSAASVIWSAISTGETSTCRVLEQSSANVEILYVVRSGSLKRTDNANAAAGSVAWTACALPGGSTPTDVTAHPTNANIVYATVGYGVYKSVDKGVTWTNITGSLPALYTNCIVYDKNSNEGLYVGNQTSVYSWDVSISDWVLFSTGLPPVDIRELEIFYDPVGTQHRLKAATYGRGLWESDLIETGVLNPVNFSAEASSTSQIDLTWVLNSSSNNVLLAWNSSSTFGTPVDGTSYSAGNTISGGGTVLYNGSAVLFDHTSLSSNTQYFYKLWSYDGSTNYSSGTTANATTSLPVADFNVDNTISCTGSLIVNFTDASVAPYNSWAWDVDNNGTTDYTTQNPTHTYSSPGLYSVKLTVSNGGATTTKENLILVMSSEPTINTGCTLSSNSNSGNNFGIGIFRFALGNIDNSTSYNDGYYQNYVCSNWTPLELNTSYNITVQTGTANNEGASVYLDYNDNGTFEAGELLVSFPSNTSGTRTLSFTTPSTGVTLDKELRLRVLSEYYYVPSTACDIGDYGQAEDYTVYIVSDASWSGTTSTDWATSGNWNINSVPVSGAKVKIPSGVPNYPVLTSNLNCEDLTIMSGASVTINSGASLTVTNLLTNSGGNTGLVIKSDNTGTGSLIHSNSGVPATVERYMTGIVGGTRKWHLISSSVAAHGVSSFLSTNTNVHRYDAGGGNMGYPLAPYNESDNTWSYYFDNNIGSDIFSPGQGMQVFITDDPGGIVNFAGGLNSGPLGISVARTSGTNRGWNLIANPYPSGLDADLFLDGNDGEFESGYKAIYLSNGTNGYTAYNYVTNIDLPVGQGFFIKADPSGTMNFTDAMRTHSMDPFKTSKSLPFIKLYATTGGVKSNTRIYYLPGMSIGIDEGFDAVSYYSGSSSLLVYTDLIEGGDYNLEIQALPDDDYENLVVPVGINAPQGSELIFRVEVNDLPIGMKVYLEDRYSDTFHRLDIEGNYYSVVLSEDLQGTGRFFIQIKNGITGVPDVIEEQFTVVPKPREQKILIRGSFDPGGSGATANLYDMEGRLVVTSKLTGHEDNEIRVGYVKNGIYLLQLQTGKTRYNQKISWINN